MKNTFQVRVLQRGTITIPKELRDRNQITEGRLFHLIDLGDGLIVMRPNPSRVDEIADKLAKEWREAGMTLESMLSALRTVREEGNANRS